MGSFERTIHYITEQADELAQRVVDRVCADLSEEVPAVEQRRAFKMYRELWKSLGESLQSEQLEIPEALMVWSRNNAAMQTKSGGKISVIVNRYPATRAVMSDLLLEIGEEMGLTLPEFVSVNKQVNTMLDLSLNETYYAFEQLSELYRKSAELEIAKLSAPIVPLHDGIVVIPLMGEITDERAYTIMNNVLPNVSQMDIHCAIADFSGLLTVDDQVIRSLRQIEGALSLMGIQVISTGMRPELAQKVVNSGMELTGTTYYATVKQALESLT